MRDRRTGLKLLLTVCIVALLGSTGCSSATSSAASAPAAPATQHSVTPNAAAPPDAAGVAHGAATVPASPQDAALQLEALLGQHAVLAADMMRGRIRNDEDFGQAANAAIGRNTDDLAAAGRGPVRGGRPRTSSATCGPTTSPRCSTTRAGWPTDDAGDPRPGPGGAGPVRERSRRVLLVGLPGPAEPAGGPVRGAHPRRPPARAGRRLRDAGLRAGQRALPAGLHAHLRAGSRAGQPRLLPADQAAVLTEPQWRLRSELGRLLGEHVALAVGALRAGADRRPDFAAAAAALNGNTSDLTGAIGSLFGAAGRQPSS